MSKIDLSDVNSGYNRSAINSNFQRIKDFLNDRVLMRNNVSGEPNAVLTDIDFNGKRLYNLPAPSTNSEPARLQDLSDVVASGAVLATSTNDGLLSKTGFTKLAGIDDNATRNSTDIALLSRTNHTGFQAISTVTNLQPSLDAKQDVLVSGTSIKTVNSTSLLGSGNVNTGTVTSVNISGGTTGLTTSGGPVTTSGTVTLGGTLAVANGGTGTATPSLVAGTNVTISGSWPNQTINSSGGGGDVTLTGTQTLTNKTFTNPAINGFTGDTSAINIGSGQIVKDTSGNVGVGKTPVSKLDVGGSVYAGADTNVAAYLYSSGAEARIGVGGRSTVTNVPLTIWMSNGGSNFETAKFDTAGNFTLSTPGGLGYGTGAGGTVTQATSKSTAVTLNKPTGRIQMDGASLAAGATVTFTVNNSLVTVNDVVHIVPTNGYGSLGAYQVVVDNMSAGSFRVNLKNNSVGALAEALQLMFVVIKGAIA